MSHLGKPLTHKHHRKDPSLLQILENDPHLLHINSYHKSLTPKLITLHIIKQSFHTLPRSYINKQSAHKVYISQLQNYATDNIVNPAQFGKCIKILFPNVVTKRLGARVNSLYVYYGLTIKPHLTHLLTSLEQEQPQKSEGIQLPLIILAYLKDTPVPNRVLQRCDLLISNFIQFNLIQMEKDWNFFNLQIQDILQENNVQGFQFDIMNCFNKQCDPRTIGITTNEFINPLKFNILTFLINLNQAQQGIDSHIKYLEFQHITNQILILFTRYQKLTFGNFWILKCYIDEFYKLLIDLKIFN